MNKRSKTRVPLTRTKSTAKSNSLEVGKAREGGRKVGKRVTGGAIARRSGFSSDCSFGFVRREEAARNGKKPRVHSFAAALTFQSRPR